MPIIFKKEVFIMMVLILAVICCVVVFTEVYTYRPSAAKHGIITKNKTYRHTIAVSKKTKLADGYSARAYRRYYKKTEAQQTNR